MKLITVGAGVLNQTPLDWDGNRDRVLRAMEAAREAAVDVLCLPEMCIPGYGCQDAFLSPSVQQTALDVLMDEILPQTRGLVVSVGLPVAWQASLFNAVALLVDGRLAGFACKRNLAGDGVHYEPRWFKPWPAGRVAQITIRERRYPLGDPLFDVGGVRLGFEICEDAWVASRPGSAMAGAGVDIILNPSASHFAFDKLAVRKRFVLEGSRAFAVTYVYANLVGNDAGRLIYDGGALIATGGRLVAEGPRLSFADVSLTHATVDVEETRRIHASTASIHPRFDAPPAVEVQGPELLRAQGIPTAPKLAAAPWEGAPHPRFEEFSRALALGLFDYMRRSYSRGFVVSLSGGADSAAVAVLVWLMARLATDELGPGGFRGRLGYLRDLAEAEDLSAIMPSLLVTAYQATRNSSDTTLQAAREVAEAVGAQFLVFDVDELVARYVEMVQGGVGRALTWEHDDLALQNIQARVRAPGVWMLANLRGALLCATSNRSEAAVGYATMDGDTAGGLSPIAGIDKNFIRGWLRWMERDGPLDVGPLPALGAINAQQPTAELRPASATQTDEGDLMPYDVLDAIERAAIRDKQDPTEVWALVCARFPHRDAQQLAVWVERFFQLWSRNQWKRERYAPSFHVDDENLDPKTWCRFPILSGGFRRELGALRAAAAARRVPSQPVPSRPVPPQQVPPQHVKASQ